MRRDAARPRVSRRQRSSQPARPPMHPRPICLGMFVLGGTGYYHTPDVNSHVSYPIYADFEPLKKDHLSYEHQPMKLVPLADDGSSMLATLNCEFTPEYLADKRNPRWVAKPPVAYLWARTVQCKNCRAEDSAAENPLAMSEREETHSAWDGTQPGQDRRNFQRSAECSIAGRQCRAAART